MKVYVDASPKAIALATEDGKKYLEGISGAGLTSNQAEYYAVTIALDDPSVTEVLSDSQLVVHQLNGTYAVRDPKMSNAVKLIWDKVRDRNVKFTWIPREQNPAGKILG